jgi:hypothetical protein
MTNKKVSLREMMEDDNSAYMSELVQKFDEKYGDQLDKIIAESKRIGAPVSSRMGFNSNIARRSRTNRI